MISQSRGKNKIKQIKLPVKKLIFSIKCKMVIMFKIEADYELLNYYDTIRKKQTKEK